MKIYSPTAVGWALLTYSIIVLSGCTKNSINIDLGHSCEQDTDDSNTPPNGSQSLVTFHASIEGRNMTRALSPMRKGLVCRISAFKSPVASLELPTAEGLYTTETIGILTGVDGYKMYLPNGVYNFFGISNNTSSTPIQFNSQYSQPLVNGVDYLWSFNKLQDVASSQISMPIIFQHSASQVVFKVSSGTGIQLNKLISAALTPGKPGTVMNIITGKIVPATTYDSSTEMGINGFTAQYILLPVQTNTPMQLIFQVLADGETSPRTYQVSLSLPNGKLSGGDSYVFSAVIDGNTVSFPEVEVLNWTEVDETGKPFYPTQTS